MSDLMQVAQSATDTAKGSVRLAVTEGIGTFWIIPQLVDFLSGPGRDIQVTLQCALSAVDVLRLEADISIQTREPTSLDVGKHRLGWVHMTLFAGRSYVERHGLPKTLADLAHHKIIEQDMGLFPGYGLDQVFSREASEKMVSLRTNFASAHYWAVAKGAGIGLLPNYAVAIGGDLVPIDIGMRISVELWLAVHPELVKTERHQTVVEWLNQCFSSETYPWFGERFMDPTEIQVFLKGSSRLRTYFTGFTPVGSVEARRRLANQGNP
ncbi:LysR substrate-binding domain-containing protein [Aureimonas pseudogalii]|uniref:DNA-binding transcriptional LysR family regulator n=1 Tax=Aureimonas pseudogalii TaxID=1744844 RepID=A0A7W6MLT3_9HYPH|nr:LysR substrate-binding domain-containing protein [Aureimonas pseudogalii]MBB4000094.1 DNA-binding transcriptional LysR family regulator [Aureimonas pseudogalii]